MQNNIPDNSIFQNEAQKAFATAQLEELQRNLSFDESYIVAIECFRRTPDMVKHINTLKQAMREIDIDSGENRPVIADWLSILLSLLYNLIVDCPKKDRPSLGESMTAYIQIRLIIDLVEEMKGNKEGLL